MLAMPRFLLLLLATTTVIPACKTYDPLYCDADKACTDPERPFCDVKGEYPASEGVGRTCIPNPFDAGAACSSSEFLGCEGTARAIYCNSEGTQQETKDCQAVCSEEKGGCACDCPAGPEGPEGPAGPAGPGFSDCEWTVVTCNATPGVECAAVCPAGMLVAAGGCDVSAGGAIVESRPSPGSSSEFDRWICESTDGNVQGATAFCCPP